MNEKYALSRAEALDVRFWWLDRVVALGQSIVPGHRRTTRRERLLLESVVARVEADILTIGRILTEERSEAEGEAKDRKREQKHNGPEAGEGGACASATD